MEKGLSLAVIVIAVAITFWRPLRQVRAALGLSHLTATGHVFLVLGYVLGFVSGGYKEPVSDDLGPIVAFVSGWVGFATGIRLDLRILRTIPLRCYTVALFPAVFTALVVGTLGVYLLRRAGIGLLEASAAALIVAAAAASSGPTLVAMLRSRRAGRASEARPVLRMIEFSAGVDDLVVIALAMFTFASFRASAETFSPVYLVATSVAGGALLGVVTWLFLGGRANEDERLLLGLGMLIFIAGFAGWLYFSPAAIAAVSAMVLVNLPSDRTTQLMEAVRRVERPAVVILMAVIGYHITGRITWLFFPLVLGLTLVRILSRRFAELFVARVNLAPGLRTFPRWTDGLTPQGILGLMVALSFFHVWHDDLSRTVLAAIAVASILNEIVSPWLFLSLMRDLTSPKRPLPKQTAEVNT